MKTLYCVLCRNPFEHAHRFGATPKACLACRKKYYAQRNNHYIPHPSDGLGKRSELNRLKALERDNYTCQVCGKKALETRLHVHHKDNKGRTVVETNNSLDNLITLCPQCHTNIHGRQKTILDRPEVKELILEKLTHKEIAFRLNLSRGRVSQIVRRLKREGQLD